MDIYWLFGGQSSKPQTVGGSPVTVTGAAGLSLGVGYGYQIVRESAASLWIEVSSVFTGGTQGIVPGVSGTFNWGWSCWILPGIRVMVPVESRISVYGAGGGAWRVSMCRRSRSNPFPRRRVHRPRMGFSISGEAWICG
jgi:hypothetical protein